MRIGELADRVGVTAKTIRYYEAIGILPTPERSSNGYREYTEDAVVRLRFIRDAQATGLTLTEIASILDLRGQGEATCGHVQELLERHLLDLDGHIDKLMQTRIQLEALTERARGLDPADCTDPNRCQTIEALAPTSARPGVPRLVHTQPAKHGH